MSDGTGTGTVLKRNKVKKTMSREEIVDLLINDGYDPVKEYGRIRWGVNVIGTLDSTRDNRRVEICYDLNDSLGSVILKSNLHQTCKNRRIPIVEYFPDNRHIEGLRETFLRLEVEAR